MQGVTQQPAETGLMAKAWWKIVPLIMVIYMVSVIDKQNVSFAKLQMVHDLKMTEAGYGFASSLYFIGYTLASIPSSIAAGKFGARKWFAQIMLVWGIASIVLAFCTSGSSFSFLRFLVGAAEGGLYPGIIYYFGLWFKGQHRVRALGLLTVGSALGNVLGAAFGGVSLSLNGLHGLTGWQWIFIITGGPAILLVPIVMYFLPSTPAEAKFLSKEESGRLEASLVESQNSVESHKNILTVLWDARVLLFSLAYAFLLTAYYGVIYWLPTVVKQFGVGSAQNGFLNMIPWGLAAVMLVVAPRYFRIQSIVSILGVISTIGLLCFFGSIYFGSAVGRFASLSVGTASLSLLLPCFWFFASRFFTDKRASASIAAVCTYANLGGFFAQNLMPRVAQAMGSPAAAMIVPAACLVLLAVSALLIRWRPAVIGQLAGPQTVATAGAK